MSQKKHLGYEYWFEVYLIQDRFETKDWQKNLSAVSRYLGFLKSWIIFVHIEDSTIRYFIGSNRDIGSLSNNLYGLVLRPASYTEIAPPLHAEKEPLVQLVSGGSILDLREKYQIKRNKSLEWVSFKIRSLDSEKTYCDMRLCFKSVSGEYTLGVKHLLSLPAQLLSVDFLKNTKYLRNKQTYYLDIQKALNIMRSESLGAVFEVDTFPYLPNNYYLPLESYDFDRHSLIVGASGSGKSKLIGLIIKRLLSSSINRQKYRVVVVDPHASLEEQLGDTEQSRVVSFKNADDGAELFAGSGTDIMASTELTVTLFRSLLADQYNPKLERVLRFSLYVLMTGQVMSLDSLKRFITDIEYRESLLEHVGGFIPDNIGKFFGTDFNELRTKYYNEVISPISSLVDEMQMQPSLGSQNDQSVSLAKLINTSPLTLFSLNKAIMGDKVVKTVAGLLIQQIFLLAQAKVFNEKVILIIDEVSVVQNPALVQILAEARKYNLFVFLTQQYFGQINNELREAIFANVANYYVFRVSEEDARALEGNLTIELPKELIYLEKEVGNRESEIRIKLLTSLHDRECLLRLSAHGQMLPVIKAKTMEFAGMTMKNLPDLKQYKSTALPTKFQESILAESSFTDSEIVAIQNDRPIGSPTLEEFLASQSLNIDKREKDNG